MNNQQLIKYAHVWFLVVLIACGVVVLAVQAGSTIQNQNSNQNSNSNSNRNANASSTQNRNANRSASRNSTNTSATGQAASMSNMSSQEHDFVMDAAMGGLMEVELGRIAAQKGMSESVKQFGQ